MWPVLVRHARRTLARQGIHNVELCVGDGSCGVPDRAPYDAILASAAGLARPPTTPTRRQSAGWSRSTAHPVETARRLTLAPGRLRVARDDPSTPLERVKSSRLPPAARAAPAVLLHAIAGQAALGTIPPRCVFRQHQDPAPQKPTPGWPVVQIRPRTPAGTPLHVGFFSFSGHDAAVT